MDRHPFQWGNPQHAELSEDLDALVDPETQRIMDEADLLEFSEDDDDEDGESDEDEWGSGDEDDGSEDDQEDTGSPSKEQEHSRDASASPEAAGTQARQPAEGLAGTLSQQAVIEAADPLDGLGPLSPIQDMSLPQNLDDEEAIHQRTRARMPLNHVSLDELDALLGREDEGLFDEEGEQYQQFLRVLRGEEDLRELLDDDDEDEDFTLDWDELMGPDPFGQDNGEPPPPPRRSQRQRAYTYRNKNERPGHKERPVESTVRVQSKQLKPLLPNGRGLEAGAGPEAGRQQLSWGDQHSERLRALIAQHAQLLTTAFAMGVQTPSQTQSAGLAGQMLHGLQGVPQWLWSPALEKVASAVTEAISLQEAVSKIGELPACFSSALLPQVGYVPQSEGWQCGEDALLARGVRRFGKRHEKVHEYFLPTRSGADIIARIKHLTRPSAAPNPVKAAHQRNIGPLLPHEMQILEEQLRFLGKQPKRWELIISKFMPYRTVAHLSKLWAAHQAVLKKSAPGMLHWTLVLGNSVPPAAASTDICHPQQLALPGGVPLQLAGQDPAQRGHVPIAQAARVGMPPWPAQRPDQAAAPQYQPAASSQLAVPAQASLARPENSQPAIQTSVATDTRPLLSAPQSQSAMFVPLALPPSIGTVAMAPYSLPDVQPQSSNAHLPPTLPAPGQHSQGFPAPFPTSSIAAKSSYTNASQIQRGPVFAPPSSVPLQAAGHMQRTPALAGPSTSTGSGALQAVGLMQRTHMIAAPSTASGPRLQAAGHIQSMSMSAPPVASLGTAARQQQQQQSCLPVTTSGSAALSGSLALAALGPSLGRDSAQQQQHSRFLVSRPGSGGLCTFTAQHSSAFAPYQRPNLPRSSMGEAVQPGSSCATIPPLFMPKPVTRAAPPQARLVHSSPTIESVPGSLGGFPNGVSPPTRSRKRKQPAPSHAGRTKPVSEPSLDELDDALLSAANARIRGGPAGRRRTGRTPVHGARSGAGPGSSPAGPSPEAPTMHPEASGGSQDLLGPSARLAANAGQPMLPRPAERAAAAASQALQTAPFWHLPPSSPPQQALAAASQPQLAAAHSADTRHALNASATDVAQRGESADGDEAMHHASASDAAQRNMAARESPANGKIFQQLHPNQQPESRQTSECHAVHAAATTPSAAAIEPLTAAQSLPKSCDSASKAQLNAAVRKAEHPHCRKSLHFSDPAHEVASQPSQQGTIPHRDAHGGNTVSNAHRMQAATTNSHSPGQIAIAQQRLNNQAGVHKQPALPSEAENGAQASSGAMARSGHAARSEQETQGKGGDAELMIGGVLTRWTQAEDKAILHAALRTNGTLSVDACARIMRLPRNHKSYPLLRTAKHIRGRLDWLLSKLLGDSKQSGI